ncbi:epigen-like isoform X2 [Sphaeramia orbicularis]|uniref:epigen-like isoform X2 n=1 Tax=Sphaeramia orbicularis TaxID=375764 RepID=UPI001180D751|nr:epigen-like isoform X2 [Sphaeramia orbicularis]
MKMRSTNLDKVAVLVLLSTMGQCAVLTEDLQTTTGPDPTTSSTNTYTNNSSMDQPLVLRSHRSDCGDEHADFCANGGVCMYPQDSTEPSCICAPSFGGPRCMILSQLSHTHAEIEQVIGITFGVAMILLALFVTVYCCIQRRCVKSPPLIKSAPATSV